MKFRPCIDLHDGQVKQIVGATLNDDAPENLQTNFTANKDASWFAQLYRGDNLTGGHIIKLGPGNDKAALSALKAWPDGMQVGGGITDENAAYWIENGASHVIVTSHVFNDGKIDEKCLGRLVEIVGRERLVLDLSCRRRGDEYFIVTDRWQKFTDVTVCKKVLDKLAESCSEFLIHAADVEGQCRGVEEILVERLGAIVPIPTTYAGGVRDVSDLKKIDHLSNGKLDVTIGSALDIFGGDSISYREAVDYCK